MKIIKGGIAVDDRGSLRFVNDFDFSGVKRFYAVDNHSPGFVRAWHGHRYEEKFVTVLRGSALIAGVLIDNWDKPSSGLKVSKFVLSDKAPAVLHIPAGYANGFKTLEEGTQVIFFSSSTLDDSLNDDYRFDSRYWDVWSIEER